MAARALVLTVLLATLAAPAQAGNGVKLLRQVPDDVGIVAVLDVAASRRRALFRAASEQLLGDERVKTLVAAGIDPVRDIDTVLLATVSDDPAADPAGAPILVLEGRFASDVLDRLFPGPDVRRMKRGAVGYVVDGDWAMALVGKRLVAAKAPQIDRLIDLAAGKGASLARSRRAAALRGLVSATDTRHQLWAISLLPAPMRTTARGNGLEVDAVTLGATLGAALHLELRLLFASEPAAATGVSEIRGRLGQLETALSSFGLPALAASLAADVDGPVVRVTGSATEQEIRSLLGVVGLMASP